MVLIHDVFGMTQDLRNQADWLAAQGFVAVAPDLFHDRTKMAAVRGVHRDVDAREGRTFDEVEAVRGWTAGTDECAGAVGVVGFCMGGGLALAGCGQGLRGIGRQLRVGAEEVPTNGNSRGRCPIVASYGARDRSLRQAAARLERALAAAGVSHDVKEYPDAGHGFLNDHEGARDRLPALFSVMARIMAYGTTSPPPWTRGGGSCRFSTST